MRKHHSKRERAGSLSDGGVARMKEASSTRGEESYWEEQTMICDSNITVVQEKTEDY